MSQINKVWVFSENIDGIGELCTAGFELGTSVEAVVIGSKEEADKAVNAGANKVYLLENRDGHILEDYLPSLKALIAKEQPQAFLLKITKKTRLMAGRLAAAFKTSVITDVSKLWVEDDKIAGEHMVYGGAAMRIEKSKAPMCIALVVDGVFDPYQAANNQGEIVPVDYVPSTQQVKLVERRPRVSESVNLAVAKRVVGIGRGLAKQEDLKMMEDLAQVLEAEMGCSRPIAEGVNWMARERYIGVSGAILRPDIYLAIGISGQVQHMVGVNTAKTIIAINKDKNAHIFEQADYGIVGDLYTIVPSLIQKLKVGEKSLVGC